MEDFLEIRRWGRNRNREKTKPLLGDKSKNIHFPFRSFYSVHASSPSAPEATYDRSVIVAVSYKKYAFTNLKPETMAAVKANTQDAIDYLLRFEGLEGFSKEGHLTKKEVHHLLDDSAVFKMIVSPEDAELLTEDYIKELMLYVEEKCGQKLTWAAAFHHNTAHPHCHILISRTDGEGLSWQHPLRLSKKLVSEDIRKKAIGISERKKGKKSRSEYRHAFLSSVKEDGLSRIDHIIKGNPTKGTSLLVPVTEEYSVLSKSRLATLPDWKRELVQKRLEKLSQLAIGFQKVGNEWRCYSPSDWMSKLVRNGKLSPFKEYGEIHMDDTKEAPSLAYSGKVIKSVEIDDNTGKYGLLVQEEITKSLHYIESELSYQDADHIEGKDVSVSTKQARTSNYRTPIVTVKRGRS